MVFCSTLKGNNHSQLPKPGWGRFGRNELAITGTDNSQVKKIIHGIFNELSSRFKLAYIDVKQSDNSETVVVSDSGGWTYRIRRSDSNHERFKTILGEQDLVFLNGNHFSADRKVVVYDSRTLLIPENYKPDNVELVLLANHISMSSSRVKKITDKDNSVPVCRIGETECIAQVIKKVILSSTPPLSGLVLAGGESKRMRTDKTVLEYHGKPQREHLYELLNGSCTKVSVSCRREQADEMPPHFDIIPDSFIDMGPMGALLSAFRSAPGTAWLAVACDLPLLSSESLEYLVENRNPSKIATAFNSPANTFPEPLVTIWEPKSYPVLLHYLSLGYTCPRKALINSDIELLEIHDPGELMNVNRPTEYETAVGIINDPER